MSTYIGGEQSPLDKIMMWGAIVLFVAFLAYIPTMFQNKQDRLDKAWKTQGCEMYDDEKIADVPAKCQTFFIDHYAPQERRLQP